MIQNKHAILVTMPDTEEACDMYNQKFSIANEVFFSWEKEKKKWGGVNSILYCINKKLTSISDNQILTKKHYFFQQISIITHYYYTLLGTKYQASQSEDKALKALMLAFL